MTHDDHPLSPVDRQRLLAVLAEREAGHITVSLSDADEATLADLQAELATLADDLRQPPPACDFEEESDCRRAVELVESMGRPADGSASDAAIAHGGVAHTGTAIVERLGPYEVTTKLGEGGMGAVYKATHPKLKRTVAIKVLPARRLRDAAAVARFEREMEAVGSLNHPNIVTAHDAGEDAGMHYLVMEYVDGVDLATLVERVGPLRVADACEIIRQAAHGLMAAHDRGIVHRDVKPSNIMLAQGAADQGEPIVKILDFGLARLGPLHAEIRDLTSTGQIMGSLKYMAPEQCASSREVDARADVYSLGATFYKLLSGSAPFSQRRFDSPLMLLAALGGEDPPPLAAGRPDLKSPLVAIVNRMMAKNPADRFATLGEVVEEIRSWSAGADLGELLHRARSATTRRAETDERVRDEATGFRPAARRGQDSSSAGNRRRALLATALFLAGFVAAALVLPLIGSWKTAAPENDDVANDPFQRARAAAKWIQSRGGAIEVAFDDTGSRALGPTDALPKQNFHLNSASLAGSESVGGSDLARFSEFPFFYSLMLNRTPVDDADVRELGRLPLLRCLYLSETKVTDAALADLKRYPQLTHLHLQGTAITDAGLVHLAEFRNLNQLYLVGCRVSDAGLSHLVGLKKLGTLWLENTNVTAAGIAKLKRALPGCFISSSFSEMEIAAAVEALREGESLPVEGDAIGGPLSPARRVAQWLVPRAGEIEVTTARGDLVTLQTGEQLPDDFHQLVTTNLDGNQELSNDDLARFDKLPLFTSIGVGRTNIGDAGLRQLGELPRLQMLFLSDTAVTDAGLEQLRRFPKLEVLHLSNTQVTDAGLENLARSSMLVDLSLIGCSVTDSGLHQLTGLKRLRILALDRTGVTPRGIVTLQQSLPDCEIRSDYSEEELAEALESLPKILTQPEER